MTGWLQLTQGALVAASVYLLLGLAWNIVYSSCGYLNLAIGEFYVLAGVLAAKLPGWIGIPSGVTTMPFVLIAIGLLAYAVERTIIRPLGDRELAPLIALVGVALVLTVVIDELVPEVAIRPDDFVRGPAWQVGGILVARQEAFIVGAAVLVSLALHRFATRTDLGRMARASADDRGSAETLGLPVARIETWAFVVAMIVTAIAATVTAPVQGVAVGLGELIALKAFLAVSIFGIGNHRGAVAGALLVGLGEAYIARYWSSDVRSLVVLGLLLVTLIARPGGLPRGPAPPLRLTRSSG